MNSLMTKPEYGRMYASEDRLWWYTGLRDLLRYYITMYASGNPYILDAGCGTGKNLEFLLARGYKNVEGFDYSRDAIDFCRKRGLEFVKQGSVTDIHHADQCFDIIYCMDVLGHLEENERKAAVSELFRVLKPGGILICNSAALEVFRSQHDAVVNLKTRFTRQEMRALFDSRLVTVKLSYRVFLLSPLVLLFKMIKKMQQKLDPSHEPQSDQQVFPFGINWLLTQVQLFENRIFRKFDLPFGSSVFIVLRKCPGSQGEFLA